VTTRRRVNAAKEIVIVGGGPVGVEMAGEIATDYPEKKVTLIHSKDQLLSDVWTSRLRKRSLKKLQKLHVTVILSERAVVTDEPQPAAVVEDVEYPFEPPELVTGEGGPATITLLQSGRVLRCDLYCLATGFSVNNQPLRKHFAQKMDEKGHIKVNDYLQVEGYEHIFAVGDINNTAYPKMAFRAIREADVAANNVRALAELGKARLKTHSPGKPAIVLTVCRYGGLVQLPNGLVLGDFFARKLKSKDLMLPRIAKTELNYKRPVNPTTFFYERSKPSPLFLSSLFPTREKKKEKPALEEEV